jgi:hypothetical protein
VSDADAAAFRSQGVDMITMEGRQVMSTAGGSAEPPL